MFLQCTHFCGGVYFWGHVYLKEGSQGCSFWQTDAALGQMNGEGNSLVNCERKWPLEWKILQMWSIYSPALTDSFESGSKYSREKEHIWPWLMLPLLLVIHPVLQARWEKQVVPQLVSYWRGKKSLLFSSRSQSEQPLLLAQVNGESRGRTQRSPQLLLLLETSLLKLFFWGKIKEKRFDKTGTVFFWDLESDVP